MEVTFVLGLVTLLIVLSVLLVRYGRYLYLVTKVKGPSLWDFVILHARELLGDNLVYHVHKLTKAYKFKPWGMWTFRGFVVVVSDCETIGEVYKTKSLYSKPNMFYDQMAKYMGRGLLILNGEDYKRHRKLAGPAFRKSVVDNHLSEVIRLTAIFMEKLREIANGHEIDIRPLIRDHAGLMSSSIFSAGHFPIERMNTFFPVVELALRDIQLESVNPVYYYLWHRFKKTAKDIQVQLEIKIREAKIIYDEEKVRGMERWEENTEKKITSVMDVLMEEATNWIVKEGKMDEEGLAEVLNVLSASQDTTSFITNTTLLLVALHPEVQQRIHEEIDSVLGDPLRTPDLEDIAQLNYLEMAVKETMRIFPAAPIIGRKAEEEVEVGGVTIPKGCTVLINIFALHRNPDIYKDPSRYDPSRFSPELSEGRNSHAFVPFSAGFRNCPGQLQAWLMLKTTLCYIFREYEVVPAEGLKSVDDIRPVMTFTFHLKNSPLCFRRRRNV